MLSVVERKLIVKLHKKGHNQQWIADTVGCSQPTVHRWIQHAKTKRTFETLPRGGRPTKLTKKRLSKLREKILHSIKSANQAFNSVSTKQVAQIIHNEVGRLYSMRHVERIMHKLGFSLITPRSEHVRHDQEKVDAFRDEFKKNSNRSMWVMKS